MRHLKSYPKEVDVAVKRRFTMVHVSLPTQDDRINLFKHYLNGNGDSLTDQDFLQFARLSTGFSCSDIERVVATCFTFFYQVKARVLQFLCKYYLPNCTAVSHLCCVVLVPFTLQHSYTIQYISTYTYL